MRRISSNMNNNDVQLNLRKQESRLNKANGQLSSQQRIQNLRDDPIAAGHLVRYQSYSARVEQFKKNAQTLSDRYTVAEGYINQSVQIMQRIRELAVQGANGIYTKEDLNNMSVEVNELLKELVENANSVSPDGNALFAGTSTNRTAFEVETGPVKGSSEPQIINVRYNGNNQSNNIEVDETSYMNFNGDGSRVFWAENQHLIAMRDATGFTAKEDSVISIDGQQININKGDNVYSLIAKINDSGAAVKASLDPVTSGLNISTTDAHQLWLQDVKGSTFTELGLVKDGNQRPPYNLSDGARISGGSLFDAVIELRDAMIAGNTEIIGGRALGAIDSGLNNLVTRLAETGSLYERAQLNIAKAETNQLNVTSQISREGDLDFTKAVTDMRMLEYVQQATLSTAGRLYQNTLLNYLR